MFSKVLVANRGEIAIRAFRAAYELGVATVAVFPYEDRNSEHRLKADEAYQIGEPGHPVRAYLDLEAIVEAALQAGADAIYPGYGFLSENPAAGRGVRRRRASPSSARRRACSSWPATRRARSPPPARRACRCCAVVAPVARRRRADRRRPRRSASRSSSRRSPAAAAAACAGSTTPEELREALEARMREAEAAFGDPTVFLEQAVLDPRHIEVQILADAQRRRDPPVRARLLGAAPPPEGHRDRARRRISTRRCATRSAPTRCAFARRDRLRQRGHRRVPARPERGGYVFIEMNPRIQVEHTVTEEVTDVDLVQAQMRIAAGETLDRSRPARRTRSASAGAALQCRITTEDPANGFRPDTGRITAYRSPGGAGVRLDGGTTYTGAEVVAHFDSMLVKLTCRGRTSRRRSPGPAARWPSSASAASPPTSRSCRRCSTTRTSAPGGVTTSLHRDAPAAAHGPRVAPTAAPSCSPTWPTSRSTSRTAPAPVSIDPARKLPGHRTCAGRRRPDRASGCSSWARGVRAASCAPQTGGRGHRHDLPRRAPVAAGDPGAHHATCSPSPGTSPG